jgi:hypothetical protein
MMSAMPRASLRRLSVAILLTVFALVAPRDARAQADSSATHRSSVAVYLDCRSGCDDQFIRTEITWVNWVRDRAVADVHLLITGTDAGAGGQQFTLTFLGARAFAGRGDTLSYTTNPTTTSDERRKGIEHAIALGLVPFVARTPVGAQLRVSSEGGDKNDAQSDAKNDPWNAWVFSVSTNMSMDGEQDYRNRNVNGDLQANRVTARWKTNIELQYSYRDNAATVQSFDSAGAVTAETTYTNVQRDWQFTFLQVKSLGDHWGVAGYLQVAQQTFRNQDLRVQNLWGVEYDVFPYSAFTRRSLIFKYAVGFTSFRYTDTTIFGKTRETLPAQLIAANYRVKEPWGSIFLNAEHDSYLSDPSKHSSNVNANFDVRLFKGFSLNGGGGYNWIHDQVYLPAGGQSEVDVLLRRRALLTGFSYYSYFGVSYTFGSIFNNVVNPRFQ